MSFWESSLGEVTGKQEDAFAKSFKVIPDGTTALATINNFCIESKDYLHFQVDWVLTDGDFKGQHVFQKIKAIEPDPNDKDPAKTRHRALNMLKLLYQIYGLKPKHTNQPTDDDLKVFIGKKAGIKIQEWVNKDKNGNYVSEVHKADGFKSETGVKAEVVHTRSSVDSAFSRNQKTPDGLDLGDDIPF